MIKSTLTGLFILLIGFTSGYSQQISNGMPHQLTKAELENLDDVPVALPKGITTPPTSPIRTMAEWEEIEALLITWTQYPAVLARIVEHAQLECEVMIVCADSNNVKSYLNGLGIIPTNVSYLLEPFNSIWARDYGQWTGYTNDVDSLVLIDWIYNRNRPSDNVIPAAVAEEAQVPLYEMTQAPNDLVHTGGNFMSDGMGTGFSSNLVLDENWNGNFNITNKTETEIDNLMSQFMGIDRFIKMPTLPYDVIHHIDMHMKLLDEETIMVGEYPAGAADGPQIEANLQYILSNFNSSFGTPYKVVRIPMPPENGNYPDNFGDYRTYTNAVFVNKTILVPVYEEQYDTTALRIWRQAMPGYKVVGINSNSIIQSLGAIHCITKAVGVEEPLLIIHQPVTGTFTPADDFEINATIKHRSGIQQASVYYSNDSAGPFQIESMSLTSSATGNWRATIPQQAALSTVYYYIDASAVSGKTQKRPMVAPDGYWKFDIGDAFVGIAETNNTPFDFKPIYPNPASAITVIPVHCPKSTSGTITMYDLYGRKIRTIHEGVLNKGQQQYFIHAANYESGMYMITVETPEFSASQALMIQ